jgi:hypothetical protein
MRWPNWVMRVRSGIGIEAILIVCSDQQTISINPPPAGRPRQQEDHHKDTKGTKDLLNKETLCPPRASRSIDPAAFRRPSAINNQNRKPRRVALLR